MAAPQGTPLPPPFPELFGCWLSRKRLTISSLQASLWSSTETFWKLPTPSCSPARELGESRQVWGAGLGSGRGERTRPADGERGKCFLGPWLPPRTPGAWPAPLALPRQIPTGSRQGRVLQPGPEPQKPVLPP